MKRFSVKAVVIAALALACALVLAACGGQTSSSSSNSSSTQTKPKVVVGYASDNYGTGEGQSFKDSSTYANVIKNTMENLGWEAEFKGIPYADIEKSINDGTIDCIWDNYSIQGREDKYAWSAAYTQARPVLIWKNSNETFDTKEVLSDITAISSLPSGKTIGVKAGSVTYADMPADQKAIIDSIGTLKEYPGLTQCKEALDKGEVDMVLTEQALITPLFVDAAYPRIAFDVSGTNSYGVAFKKGSEEKANAVADALRKVYTSGKLKTDFMAYFKSQGLDDATAKQAWSNIDSSWLLKDKIIVGYASDNYGTGAGQGFEDSAGYNRYIKSTLENLGWDVELKGVAYADIEKSINDGTIDCFWDNYTIQGREDKYAWSAAYMQARPILVWNYETKLFGDAGHDAPVTSISSLPSGKTIGVKAGSVTYANLPADQKAIIDTIGTLKEYPGLAQCKEAFEKGEVDMVLTEAALVAPLLVDEKNYVVMFDPVNTNDYGVAFKKGNEDKAQALSDALKNVYTSGTLKTNFDAYTKNMGLSDVEVEQIWSAFNDDWLLK